MTNKSRKDIERHPSANWPSVAIHFITKLFLLFDKGRFGPAVGFALLAAYFIIVVKLPSEKLGVHLTWVQSIFDRVFYWPWLIVSILFLINLHLYYSLLRQRETYRARIDDLAEKNARLEEMVMPNRISSKERQSANKGEKK